MTLLKKNLFSNNVLYQFCTSEQRMNPTSAAWCGLPRGSSRQDLASDCSSGELRWSRVWRRWPLTSPGLRGRPRTFPLCSVQQTHEWLISIYWRAVWDWGQWRPLLPTVAGNCPPSCDQYTEPLSTHWTHRHRTEQEKDKNRLYKVRAK